MRKGYTLLEVLVVVGLAAVLLAIAVVPLAQTRATRELDAGAQVLSATVAYARQVAVTGSGAVLRFDGRAWQVESTTGSVLRRGAVGNGVDLSVPTALSPMVFRANGTLPSDGTLTLTCPGTTLRRSIAVSAATGTAVLGN